MAFAAISAVGNAAGSALAKKAAAAAAAKKLAGGAVMGAVAGGGAGEAPAAAKVSNKSISSPKGASQSPDLSAGPAPTGRVNQKRRFQPREPASPQEIGDPVQGPRQLNYFQRGMEHAFGTPDIGTALRTVAPPDMSGYGQAQPLEQAPVQQAPASSPRRPYQAPIGRGHHPRDRRNVMSQVGGGGHFDAGFFPDGGGFRVPQLMPDELDETGHANFNLHLQPGEEVQVKPSGFSGSAPDAGAQTPMAAGQGDRPVMTHAQTNRLYSRETETPSKTPALIGAAMAGGNFLGNFRRFYNDDVAKTKRERYDSILRDYMARAASDDRMSTPQESQELAGYRELFAGGAGARATSRFPDREEYNESGTERRTISRNPETNEPIYGNWHNAPGFGRGARGGSTTTQIADYRNTRDARDLATDVFDSGNYEDLKFEDDRAKRAWLGQLELTAHEAGDPGMRAEWERTMGPVHRAMVHALYPYAGGEEYAAEAEGYAAGRAPVTDEEVEAINAPQPGLGTQLYDWTTDWFGGLTEDRSGG